MVRISHVLFTAVIATIGISSLWLHRLYNGTPFLEILTPPANDALTTAALFISQLTSPVVVLAAGVVGALLAAYEHHTRLWWLFTALLAVGISASTLLKVLIGLPRPEQALLQLNSYGFPSTHAALATLIFITVSWLSYRWQYAKRRMVTAAIGVGWLAICTSRILLGVHGVSDVIAGIMLGATIAIAALAVAPQLFSYFAIRSHTS